MRGPTGTCPGQGWGKSRGLLGKNLKLHTPLKAAQGDAWKTLQAEGTAHAQRFGHQKSLV